MKYPIYPILLFLIITLTPCKSQTKESSRINYTTPIRPNMTTWKLGKIYTDNLKYLYYDDANDMPYIFLETDAGDTTALIYNAFEHNDNIEELHSGSLLEIKYKVQSFAEPGEGDATYYDEKLESYKVIKSQ
jgi:hypothetical protein